MAADTAASAVLAIDVDPETFAARERLTVSLNRIVNRMAWRDDLLLECVWNPRPVRGQPDAPAWFVPADAKITINAVVALDGADPADVDPLTPAGRATHPEIIGLMSHEAAHAAFTAWPAGFGGGLPPAVAKAAVLLEEPRIEYRQRSRRPMDQPFLRAQSVMLDLRPFRLGHGTVEDRWAAATAALLTLGRVDAGVLDIDDVAPIRAVLLDLLGADDLRGLRGLWQEALDLDDGDTAALVDVATRWVDLVGAPPTPPPLGCLMAMDGSVGSQPPTEDDGWDDPDDSSHGSGDAAGSDSDAQPDGDGGGSDTAEGSDALAAALAAVRESAHAGAVEDIDTGPNAAPDPAVLQAKAQQAADDVKQQNAKKSAKGVFDSEKHKRSDITLGTPRLPTSDERRLARQMGEALRKAQFRDRTVTTVAAATPPGRLSGRDAMLGSAQRSRGGMVTAKPFKATVRRRVPEPPVRLGIMVDGSGSMAWATDIMATIAWAGAHAVTYAHGQSATVVFGGSVVALARPGMPPSHVTPFAADGGWENFSLGFAALDGALNLTRGSGVRLLVVVSDGHFVQAGQPQAAREAVARMRRGGGHVLWVPGTAVVPPGAVPVDVDLTPGRPGRALGSAERAAFDAQDRERRMAAIPVAITAALTTALGR